MKYCQETKLACISVAPSEERGNRVEGGGWRVEDREGLPDPKRNHRIKAKRPRTRNYREPVVAIAIDPSDYFFYFISLLTVTTNFGGTKTNDGCIAASTIE